MKKYILKSILSLCWLATFIPAWGMPGDPPGEGDPPFEHDPMPVNDYFWVLIVIALTAGTYLIYRNKKPKMV